MRGLRVAVAGLLVLAVAMATAAAAAADTARWSAPFTVSRLGSSSSPNLVVGHKGRATVFRRDFGSDAIWMRGIRGNGTLGPDRQVTPSGGNIGVWQAVGDGAGGTVIVWSLWNNALFGRRVSSGGRLGAVREIASPQAAYEIELSIGADARGNASLPGLALPVESLFQRCQRQEGSVIQHHPALQHIADGTITGMDRNAVTEGEDVRVLGMRHHPWRDGDFRDPGQIL